MSTLINICYRSSLSFIDFEGRSDGDSIRRILSIMKPRQLVSNEILDNGLVART